VVRAGGAGFQRAGPVWYGEHEHIILVLHKD
jgi:hypothetical protein